MIPLGVYSSAGKVPRVFKVLKVFKVFWVVDGGGVIFVYANEVEGRVALEVAGVGCY